MNEQTTYRSAFGHALLCLLVTTCGCGTNRGSGATKTVKVVQAGVGLPDCYLGMPIEDLQGDWQPPSHPTNSESLKTYKDNLKDGLGIKHDGKRIVGVFVYFNSDNYGRFPGQIEGGIGPQSSIEDVIRAKGQPTNIAITKSDDGEHTDLWYIEKGINYSFLNKNLYVVTIGHPNPEFPPVLKEDIGDTAIYRGIQPK